LRPHTAILIRSMLSLYVFWTADYARTGIAWELEGWKQVSGSSKVAR
jgi:hypothetical protein